MKKCIGASEVPASEHIVDASGPFLLHLALYLEIGLENAFKYVAMVFPDALSVPDPETSLIPCWSH
jgi:hypothetical protein